MSASDFKPVPPRFHDWARNVLGPYGADIPEDLFRVILQDVAEIAQEAHNQAVADCCNEAIAQRDQHARNKNTVARAAASVIVLELSKKIEPGGRWQEHIPLRSPWR